MNEMKKYMQIVECGCMDNAPSVGEPTVERQMSMTVNMNAQGTEQVKDLIDLFSKQHSDISDKDDEDEHLPTTMSDDDSSIIMRLAGVKEAAKTQDENSGGFNRATTSPDPEEYDIDAIIRDGDDLNRPKRGYAKSQDGDNPMSVKNESLKETFRARFRELYSQIKESSSKKRA